MNLTIIIIIITGKSTYFASEMLACIFLIKYPHACETI